LTVKQLAEAKQLPEEFIRSFGVYDTTADQAPAVAIPYYTRHGIETAVQLRLALRGARFKWKKGGQQTLYGLQHLDSILRQGYAILGEGTTDAWTAWHYRLPWLSTPSADVWVPAWSTFFPEGFPVYLWIEDLAGWNLADKVVETIPRVLALLPPEGIKDISDLHLDNPAAVLEIISRMRKAAQPVAALREERRRAEHGKQAKKALRDAEKLLEDPDLATRIDEALKKRGMVGDLAGARLLYLMLTSRLLRRPVNGYVEGPSAAGKNFAIDTVKALFPQDAYYELTSSSNLAAVFSSDPFEHKMILYSEISGVRQDGPGLSTLRELTWRGTIRYEYTTKTKDGTLGTALIVKPGPCGLITSTTGWMEPQLETRMFPIAISDTAEQTALIIAEQARRAQEGEDDADVSGFIALQQWLALVGETRVMIPYAKTLGKLVKTGTIRMRRDFSQLLVLIQVSAVLHQRQRRLDAKGRIIATLQDYEVVYPAVSPFLGQETGGLSPAQQEAVNAIRRLCGGVRGKTVSVAEVAKDLGIEPNAVHWRISKPLTLGYLVNEAHKGQPYRLRAIADPAIAAGAIPTPEALKKALGEDESTPTPEETTLNPETPRGEASDNENPIRKEFQVTSEAPEAPLLPPSGAFKPPQFQDADEKSQGNLPLAEGFRVSAPSPGSEKDSTPPSVRPVVNPDGSVDIPLDGGNGS
jgi:hypothetical protein